ncbi:MAG: hypothetical protein ACRD6W_14455 [Nitrososphaerales archaeon]
MTSVYGGSYTTSRGEKVKSRGEKQIADFFFQNGIKYSYEDQALTTGSAFRAKISRPDFRLLDYDVYVEYWGLVDVDDSELRRAYQRDMQWKMRQYDDNGLKCISLYPWHLNNLDGAFKAEFRKTTGKSLVTGSISDKSVYAVSVTPGLQRILHNGIMGQLELSEVELVYAPHYFVNYDCFAQGNFMYERVNLESSGMAVIEAQKGQIVDVSVRSGTAPEIVPTGRFACCETLQPQETPRSKIAEGISFTSIDALPVKITGDGAANIVQVEIAKRLSKTYNRTTKNGKTYSKTIRPYPREVRIGPSRLSNIPIVTAAFRSKEKSYRLVLQSTVNNRILSDDLSSCNVVGPHHGENLLV